jgi:hypothetical protein
LFSNTLSYLSSRNVGDQVSHPYKTTGKIIVLYRAPVYMKLFTRYSPYYHPIKYLLFLLKHPVYTCIYMALQTPCIYMCVALQNCISFWNEKDAAVLKRRKKNIPSKGKKNLSLYDLPPFLVIKSRRLAELKFLI